MITIEAAEARRLLLSLQGLADPPRRRLSPGELLALVERLGFVQLDSIQTVARAHHMVLFARNQTYRPEMLRRLLEDERRLFEHWTDRIAALIPSHFYPYWTWRFRREREHLEHAFRRWFGDGHEGAVERLLAQVRDGGALMARDLVDGGRRPSGGWWDWHPGKTALELLWRTGRLAVSRREGFQKVYDLPERVIPDHLRREEPSHEAVVDWACRGALERLGFASPAEIARFWGLLTIAEARAWCAHRLGDGVIEVDLRAEDGTSRRSFARPDVEDLIATVPEPPSRVRALSPFDPILRDRARLQRCFGFDYRIEVFVPAERRRFGYYVFPLLEGERLIGRIDMRAERDAAALDVTALWLEPGRRLTRGRRDRLEAELDRIRRFTGLDGVRFADDYLKGEC